MTGKRMSIKELYALVLERGTNNIPAIAGISGWSASSIKLALEYDLFNEEKALQQDKQDPVTREFTEKNYDDESDMSMYYNMEREEGDPEPLDFN